MADNYHKELIKHFGGRGVFSRQALLDFYRKYEPDLNEGTLSWRIHHLKEQGVIKAIKRGEYIVSDKPRYTPELSTDLVRIVKLLDKEYTDLDYCIWKTEWLNHFTRHQLGSFFIILEVEKGLMEMVFENLKHEHNLNAYMKPDETVMERYVAFENAIVIIPLVSRSPVQSVQFENGKIDTVNVPTLEKILVDLFSDEKTFYAIRGAEREYIFEGAIREYNINYSKLFGYAGRRGKEKELRQFLKESFGDILDEILQ